MGIITAITQDNLIEMIQIVRAEKWIGDIRLTSCGGCLKPQ